MPSVEEYVKLFTWLNDKSNGKINQKDLFTNYFKKGMAYRWNYVEDKDYPCNETRSTLIKYLSVAHLKMAHKYSKQLDTIYIKVK